MIEPREALAAWAIPGPWAIRPTQRGTNNRSFVVETSAGSYFLRLSPTAGDLARVRHEHTLLRRLHEAALSFAVPRPLVTDTGETYLIRDGVAISLFPGIASDHPEAGNIAQATACGEALGELDAALATIDAGPTPPGMPRFGDLPHAGSLIEDGLALLDQSPDAAMPPRPRALIAALVATIPGVCARLPAQLIHGDFYRGNVLMRGNRVSGILDFEFASPGPRAMDLAVAIRGFSDADWGTDPSWQIVEALAAGYRRRVALTSAEIEALPTLLLLREATSWVHWVGRCRQGLTTPADIVHRAHDLLRLDDHLRAHGVELIERVERAAP
ncbi:MAG: phosphotransferase [Thermomicrobiales bacterium]